MSSDDIDNTPPDITPEGGPPADDPPPSSEEEEIVFDLDDEDEDGGAAAHVRRLRLITVDDEGEDDEEELIDLDVGVGAGAPAAEGPSHLAEGGARPTIEETLAEALAVSTPEDRDRILAAALAHAEIQDAQYRQPHPEAIRTGQWKSMLATVVFILAAWVAVAPPSWALGEERPSVPPTQARRGVEAALVIQAEQIRVFEARNGRLPASLDEVPNRLLGIRYVRSNNRTFQLVAEAPDGGSIVYDAASVGPRFEAAASLLREGGS